MNVVSFSFGQTSAYMLRVLMDQNAKTFDRDFIVCFQNTGREHDKTLEFGHNIETRWGVKIVWLEFDVVPSLAVRPEWVASGRQLKNLLKKQTNRQSYNWFKIVNFKTASRIGGKNTPFDKFLKITSALPNVVARSCSRQLKHAIENQFLRKNGIFDYDSFIGIRHDEKHRAIEIMSNTPNYRRVHFPLCDLKITKQDVNSFWDKQDFKLEIENYMGNCDLCFLKARWKRVQIAKRFPEQVKWWSDWENKFLQRGVTGQGAMWIEKESVASLIKDSSHPEFSFMKTEDDNDIPCSCAVVKGNFDEDCD